MSKVIFGLGIALALLVGCAIPVPTAKAPRNPQELRQRDRYFGPYNHEAAISAQMRLRDQGRGTDIEQGLNSWYYLHEVTLE
jgi:hypothetical protein